jgi:hypothetical protein
MFTFQFSPFGILWRTVLLGIVISTPIPVTATVLSPQSQADFQPNNFAQSTADLELSCQ